MERINEDEKHHQQYFHPLIPVCLRVLLLFIQVLRVPLAGQRSPCFITSAAPCDPIGDKRMEEGQMIPLHVSCCSCDPQADHLPFYCGVWSLGVLTLF